MLQISRNLDQQKILVEELQKIVLSQGAQGEHLNSLTFLTFIFFFYQISTFLSSEGHKFACENMLWEDALVLAGNLGQEVYKQTLHMMAASRLAEGPLTFLTFGARLTFQLFYNYLQLPFRFPIKKHVFVDGWEAAAVV